MPGINALLNVNYVCFMCFNACVLPYAMLLLQITCVRGLAAFEVDESVAAKLFGKKVRPPLALCPSAPSPAPRQGPEA